MAEPVSDWSIIMSIGSKKIRSEMARSDLFLMLYSYLEHHQASIMAVVTLENSAGWI